MLVKASLANGVLYVVALGGLSKMGWIAATTVVTGVHHDQPVNECSARDLKGHAMGVAVFALPRDEAVSARNWSPLAFPAVIRVSPVHP